MSTPASVIKSDVKHTGLQSRINIFCNAAIKGKFEKVKSLLDDGFDANTIAKDGSTTLHYACHAGHMEIVFLLLKHNADLTKLDDTKKTPKDYLSPTNFEKLTQHLKSKEANVNAGNKIATDLASASKQLAVIQNKKIQDDIAAALASCELTFTISTATAGGTLNDQAVIQTDYTVEIPPELPVSLVMKVSNMGLNEPGTLTVGGKMNNFPNIIFELLSLEKAGKNDYTLNSSSNNKVKVSAVKFTKQFAKFGGLSARAFCNNCNDTDVWVDNKEARHYKHTS